MFLYFRKSTTSQLHCFHSTTRQKWRPNSLRLYLSQIYWTPHLRHHQFVLMDIFTLTGITTKENLQTTPTQQHSTSRLISGRLLSIASYLQRYHVPATLSNLSSFVLI
ncbi:hypothetical protein Fcan01_17866 [Folsomia candida]|uniref:Uncharacterized protein n=1 Tax=Folsomia candida TaxID=158441 RepID=A0A226DQC4_FOLCA|nr:hypothetical protein Fcan01_17866 [Folsomia candida]